MKKGYTHITVVLDNSGSMAGVAERTIAGYNQFKKEQVEQPGKLTWSLYEFKEDNVVYGGGGIAPFAMGDAEVK
jgi:hypothetical protein